MPNSPFPYSRLLLCPKAVKSPARKYTTYYSTVLKCTQEQLTENVPFEKSYSKLQRETSNKKAFSREKKERLK